MTCRVSVTAVDILNLLNVFGWALDVANLCSQVAGHLE